MSARREQPAGPELLTREGWESLASREGVSDWFVAHQRLTRIVAAFMASGMNYVGALWMGAGTDTALLLGAGVGLVLLVYLEVLERLTGTPIVVELLRGENEPAEPDPDVRLETEAAAERVARWRNLREGDRNTGAYWVTMWQPDGWTVALRGRRRAKARDDTQDGEPHWWGFGGGGDCAGGGGGDGGGG